MATGTSTRAHRFRRWRLGILLGILALAAAAHLLSEIYPRPPTHELSPAGRGLVADVRKMGGEALATERHPGFLGRFGKSERFHLRFSGRPLDDEALGRLLTKHGARISGLDLRNTAVTNDGLRHLAKASRLRELVLGNQARISQFGTATISPITDGGLVHLRKLDRLFSLDLGGLPITDQGLATLKDLPALGGLYLSRTEIRDPGLGRFKSLPNLAVLTLDGTRLTDAGLGGLAGATNLQSLDLSGVPLSAAARNVLKGLPRLDDVRLRDCVLLDEEVADLLKARPKLKIMR